MPLKLIMLLQTYQPVFLPHLKSLFLPCGFSPFLNCYVLIKGDRKVLNLDNKHTSFGRKRLKLEKMLYCSNSIPLLTKFGNRLQVDRTLAQLVLIVKEGSDPSLKKLIL